MDENDDLFRSFSRLGNEIVAERDRRLAEGAWERDIAFDLLAMIIRHYHEEYCPRTSSRSCLDNLLGPYPWDAGTSAVPTEVIREQILARCDQELDPVPEKIIAALRGEYLTFLWRTLRDRDVVPEPRDQEKDDEKIRSTLVGLGFNEPYSPRWGFSYICRELETARKVLSCIDNSFVDAKTIEVIRDNTLLALKSYKRFVQMLLSFYSQHAFGGARQLVATLKPEISRSDKYLKTCRLGDLIDLLVQLGEHAQKEADRQQPFWQEFLNVVFIRQDLIAQLQRACDETSSRLKLDNRDAHRAAYKIEEALEIGTQIIPGFVDHLLFSRDDYRAAFPLVIALKTSRRYEDGRSRIDYLDEMGQWGFARKDISFHWRSDYYFRSRPGRSPIILPVEDWHQDFILRHDRPIQTQLDDNDLHTLFGKFEGCRKGLERQARKVTIVRAPLGATSPLESIGITNDGSIFARDRLLAAIRAGESVMVEFKATCRDPGRNDEVDRGKIAEEMCALANTKGGILVFGMPDKDKPRDIERAQAMRQELEPSREQQRQKGDEWGPKYILDVIAGVAKGSGRDARACWPSVQYAPYLLNANDVGLEGGAVLVLAVFPMGPDDLCRVNQQVYVRVGTHCQIADNPWIDEWYRTNKKRWL